MTPTTQQIRRQAGIEAIVFALVAALIIVAIVGWLSSGCDSLRSGTASLDENGEPRPLVEHRAAGGSAFYSGRLADYGLDTTYVGAMVNLETGVVRVVAAVRDEEPPVAPAGWIFCQSADIAITTPDQWRIRGVGLVPPSNERCAEHERFRPFEVTMRRAMPAEVAPATSSP